MSTSARTVPHVTLRDDVVIPQLGYGVWQVPADSTAELCGVAFETGYRHIDTAKAYENEAQVGEAFRASRLSRDEVFVTTKLWNGDQGFDSTKEALKASLERLQLDFVDLYLIHWPVPSQDKYVETWQAFVELQKEGLTRSIGVSNFQREHLDRIIAETGVTPSVNQIELHPRLVQEDLRAAHEELGIVTEAWSPLGQGEILEDDTLREIASTHEVTPAQVVLRWHLQLGNVIFPKSETPDRIRENFDVFSFELSDEEVDQITGLDEGHRFGPDPDTFSVT